MYIYMTILLSKKYMMHLILRLSVTVLYLSRAFFTSKSYTSQLRITDENLFFTVCALWQVVRVAFSLYLTRHHILQRITFSIFSPSLPVMYVYTNTHVRLYAKLGLKYLWSTWEATIFFFFSLFLSVLEKNLEKLSQAWENQYSSFNFFFFFFILLIDIIFFLYSHVLPRIFRVTHLDFSVPEKSHKLKRSLPTIWVIYGYSTVKQYY